MPDRPTTLPALAVACPSCGSEVGQLCTSHGGTRVRRHNVHQDRTAAHRAVQQPTAAACACGTLRVGSGRHLPECPNGAGR
ncbi:zinc finger domain-containing protein [Streptomyces drozdowiczii]